MASLVMLVSMAFAQNETPMLPESHGLTDNQPAWGSSQDFILNGEWNWWSTYVTPDLTALENALGDVGFQIKSSEDGYAQNSSMGWSGTLPTISNDKMYVIGLVSGTNNYSFRLRGARVNAEQTPITVEATKWNWVGYPVAQSMDVASALVNYTPTNREIFKSAADFAQYDEVTNTWFGELVLTPGQGYMLYSMKDYDVTFTYPSVPASGRTLVSSVNNNATEWQPVMANPTNMNMIAVVNFDNEELRSENVEIGVFNGETCRGAKSPIYIEALDQYLVFLTMYGEENEPFSFRMIDKETGNVYESNEASVSYKANGVIGNVRSPFALNFNSKNSFAGALDLFPNPVNRGEMVNLTLPAESTVEVINVLGSTMKRIRMTEGSQLAADMAPGIYTIKVTDAEGKVYVDKLIVK